MTSGLRHLNASIMLMFEYHKVAMERGYLSTDIVEIGISTFTGARKSTA